MMMMMSSEGAVPDGTASGSADLIATAAAAAAAMGGEGGDDDPGAEETPTPESDGSVAAAAAVKAEAPPDAAVVAADTVVPAPVFASSGGEFVSKEHRRAGPFKAVLLYFDYVRWLWNVTDKERLDREQPQGMVSERVKVMVTTSKPRRERRSGRREKGQVDARLASWRWPTLVEIVAAFCCRAGRGWGAHHAHMRYTHTCFQLTMAIHIVLLVEVERYCIS